jgi:hypothetical protein
LAPFLKAAPKNTIKKVEESLLKEKCVHACQLFERSKRLLGFFLDYF